MAAFKDPRLNPSPGPRGPDRVTSDPEELKDLHRLCRDGYIYEIERWIQEGRPLQVAPGTRRPSRHRISALEIALEAGSHSLVLLLLCNGYNSNLEPESPLDLALCQRRRDLLDLLLKWGTDPKEVGRTELFETYDSALFESFRTMEVDLADGHEMAHALGYHTSNKPLFGFVKRNRQEHPEYQRELDMALAHHSGEGNEKGVALCLWAGADAHADVPSLRWSSLYDEDEEDEPYGNSAISESCRNGHLEILRRLGPSVGIDDFDELFRWAGSGEVIDFLAEITLPEKVGTIIGSHLSWYNFECYRRSPVRIVGRLFEAGVRWQSDSKEQIAAIRDSIRRLPDYNFVEVMKLLTQADYTSSDILQELARTPAFRRRMKEVGFIPDDEGERRDRYGYRPTHSREVLAKCGITLPKPKMVLPRVVQIGSRRPDSTEVRMPRSELFDLVWSKPITQLATEFGISDRGLGKACEKLRIPRPGRGEWPRIKAGKKVRRPRLPRMEQGKAEEILAWIAQP